MILSHILAWPGLGHMQDFMIIIAPVSFDGRIKALMKRARPKHRLLRALAKQFFLFGTLWPSLTLALPNAVSLCY
jgi:hypothetical protein